MLSPVRLVKRFLSVSFRCLLARCGFVLLPVGEIRRIEEDAARDRDAMLQVREARHKAYFDGRADYSSRLAAGLRKRFLPAV